MPAAPEDPATEGERAGGDRLQAYRAKRNFDRTAEPSGTVEAAPAADAPRFVIQKHAARALHYDLRFEAAGVLISWAVPKGPSFDPSVKRLAVHVEDHPLDYASFEGSIGSGEYGAGAVIVWDEGTYRNLTERNGHPVSVVDAVAAGHLSVWLDGAKLHGGWSLTRTSPAGDKEAWILVKRADDLASRSVDVTTEAPNSVLTGRSLEEVRGDVDSPQWHTGPATWRPPMLAQPLRVPQDLRVVAPPGWIYQRKLDGLRCVAVRNGSQVELWSRNHLSFTARFPAIVAALAARPADNFTIDGELVAFDGSRTSFARLQQPRSQQGEAPARPEFHAFDLLHLLGNDTTGLPLSDRRRLLTQAPGRRRRRHLRGRGGRWRPSCPARRRLSGRLGGADRQTSRERLPQRPVARLAQAQMHELAAAGRRRMDGPVRTAVGSGGAAGGLLRRGESASVRRPGRFGLRRPGAGRPAADAGWAIGGEVALRPGRQGQRIALGPPGDGCRGDLHGVDPRRPAAPSALRKSAAGRRPGEVRRQPG